jgi:hypothetical protein
MRKRRQPGGTSRRRAPRHDSALDTSTLSNGSTDTKGSTESTDSGTGSGTPEPDAIHPARAEPSPTSLDHVLRRAAAARAERDDDES